MQVSAYHREEIFLDTASGLVLQDCKSKRFVNGGKFPFAARKEASSDSHPRVCEAGESLERHGCRVFFCEEVWC